MPATVIDSFIVELGLDPAKFTQGQKEALESMEAFKNKAKRQTKETEDILKKVSDQFESLGRRVVTFFASVVGIKSLASFGKDIIDVNRQMGNMADVTGESIQKLSGLGAVFDRLGGSGQGVLNVISQWNREMKSMEIGALDPNSSSMMKFLNSLMAVGIKIKTTDAQGNWRKATDIFVEVSEKLAKSGVSNDIKSGLLQAAGIDNDTVAVMLRGGEAMREHLKEQERIYQITEEQRKATDKLNTQLQTLGQRAKSLGQEALIDLAHGMDTLLESFKHMTDFLDARFYDPASVFYLPTLNAARDKVTSQEGGASGSSAGGGGSSGEGKTGTNVGALGGVVHGHQVEAYGPPSLRGQTLFDPVSGKSLGGGVGGHSAMFGPNMHEGIDIMTPAGTPVFASRGGTIIKAPNAYGGLDQVLTIDHGDGTYSRYLHQGPASVKAGDVVSGGQQIGSSGHRNVDHTHFEMWDGPPGKGKLINSRAIYGWGPGNLPQGGQARTALGPTDSPVAAGIPSLPFLKFNPAAIRAPSVSNTTVKNEVNSVTVNTGAADAAGIAGAIRSELQKNVEQAHP